jgi:hypothetical protein
MFHVPEGFLGNSGIVCLVERTWSIEHMKGLLGENLVGK